jgi:short subunit dehydrogenase-like uncharacterized protein
LRYLLAHKERFALSSTFLLYGANGFVGEAAARLAVANGLDPVLAGRDAPQVQKLAAELGVGHRVFNLQEAQQIERALYDVPVVLHCAGPYIHTYQPMVSACLQTGTHYLDLTGELPVYQAIAARGEEARERGVMLLPGAGFDVVPTDCLALHLQQRLPSATRLALAFKSEGPAGLPPGTQRTVIEMAPQGARLRRNGQLVQPEQAFKTRWIDFGQGPERATRIPWGDSFTAYHSTGIPNIEDYTVLPEALRNLLGISVYLRPLLKPAVVRRLLQRAVQPGPSAERRARTVTHVWGEVQDDQGRTAAARLHGPEAGVEWTARAALAAVRRVLAGDAPAGYQTPAKAYGADFVLECEGVSRADLE